LPDEPRSLLDELELYLKRSGAYASRFGVEIANDPNLVGDMRRGRMPRAEIRQRIEEFLFGRPVLGRRPTKGESRRPVTHRSAREKPPA
jgi:hypothetical protein